VLAEWEPWKPRPIESLTSLPATTIGELIADVVAAEGPVLFGRVGQLLRTASGASRMGAAMQDALDRGLVAAISSGAVAASPPDASGDSGRRTLRVPGQETKLRVLEPRNTWEVPPDELGALAQRIVAATPDATRVAVKRRLASLYRWSRYTPQLDELLESVLPRDVGQPDRTTTKSEQRPVRHPRLCCMPACDPPPGRLGDTSRPPQEEFLPFFVEQKFCIFNYREPSG
jgi:hypothetical protein